MSLSTGRRLHCYQWTELPVPDYVIDRVEEMATKEKQPVMTNGHPIFEWRPGVPVLDEGEVKGEDHEDDAAENGAMYDEDSGDNESDHEDSGDDKSDHEGHDNESLHDIQNDDSAIDDAIGAAYATDDDVDTVNDADEIDDDDHDNDPNGDGVLTTTTTTTTTT
jgi:hypothetical protein